MLRSKASGVPKWKPAPAELTSYFAEQLSRLPEAQPRKMFGYLAGFVQGQMFAGIFQDTIVLRLRDADRSEFLRSVGGAPFEPMPGRTMREYVVAPQVLIKDSRRFGSWLAKACSYAASLSPKVFKAKGSRGKPT